MKEEYIGSGLDEVRAAGVRAWSPVPGRVQANHAAFNAVLFLSAGVGFFLILALMVLLVLWVFGGTPASGEEVGFNDPVPVDYGCQPITAVPVGPEVSLTPVTWPAPQVARAVPPVRRPPRPWAPSRASG